MDFTFHSSRVDEISKYMLNMGGVVEITAPPPVSGLVSTTVEKIVIIIEVDFAFCPFRVERLSTSNTLCIDHPLPSTQISSLVHFFHRKDYYCLVESLDSTKVDF